MPTKLLRNCSNFRVTKSQHPTRLVALSNLSQQYHRQCSHWIRRCDCYCTKTGRNFRNNLPSTYGKEGISGREGERKREEGAVGKAAGVAPGVGTVNFRDEGTAVNKVSDDSAREKKEKWRKEKELRFHVNVLKLPLLPLKRCEEAGEVQWKVPAESGDYRWNCSSTSARLQKVA